MDEHEKIFKVEKRRKDKSQIATQDKVLDQKTINILQKLQERGKLIDMGGSVSSGKEANIYTARCSTSLISKFIQNEISEKEEIIPVALKIYKTSTMMFKDRTRYIMDEKRFKNFCKSNSRKLIKVWSEKEVRNLKRLIKAEIPCPRPLYLKKSILIMTLIGTDLTPAPRLKDVNLKPEEWQEVYHKCIKIVKDMYQKARLIHADLSEYNLIYHNGELFVIDVSQSMDTCQENSNTFLVMDLCNMNEFFAKKDVNIIGEVDLFEDITKLKVPEYLKVNGKLNKDSFIPSRIMEVANKEDLSLFITDYKDCGLSEDFKDANNDGYNIGCENNDINYSEEEYLSYEENTEDEELEYYSDENLSYCEADEDDESLEALVHDIQDIELESIASEDVEFNEISETFEDDWPSSTPVITSNQVAEFNLKQFSDLTEGNINLYIRRLRLKYPEMTKEQEKAINKVRKSIIKEMNKERRVKRVIKKEEYKKKNKKRNKNYRNK